MLRNVNTSKLDSPRELKQLILDQFGGEIVPGDLKFDVGYFRGNIVSRARPSHVKREGLGTSVYMRS